MGDSTPKEQRIYLVTLILSGEVTMRIRASSEEEACKGAEDCFDAYGSQAQCLVDDAVRCEHAEPELDENQEKPGCVYDVESENEIPWPPMNWASSASKVPSS